jgi:hypothetical protein
MKGRPRKYTKDGIPGAGFVAQEEIAAGRHEAIGVEKHDDPQFATSDGVAPDGHRFTRNYNHDIAYLTAALQNALTRIAQLEAK